jgi:HAD superfamily hydrolase (TIGR01490 family)
MYHIFDVDHTVYEGSTVMDYLLAGLSGGSLRPGLVFSLPLYTLLFLSGRGNQAVEGRVFPFLKGMRRGDLRRTAEELFSGKIREGLNARIVELAASLKRSGESVILATSSFSVLVEPLAEYLSADRLIATELEFDGDIATGRLSGVPAFGSGKLERIAAFFAGVPSGEAELKTASFYTDSHRDLPLLNAVGRPVAVNPDQRLERIALERNWEIFRTSGKKAEKEKQSC